jgi:hypothetical protein
MMSQLYKPLFLEVPEEKNYQFLNLKIIKNIHLYNSKTRGE